MSIEWSGLSPELMLSLDRQRSQPLRAQLEEQLRAAIRHGRLRAGERLPSSRSLAGELGLSRGLVQECYAQLLSEGYLTARTGSATVVAPCAGLEPAAPAQVPAPAPLLADFALGVPDLASFPRAHWTHALREACRTAPTASFGYEDPRGNPMLREVLAAYLRRVRAAEADPERIVICAGFAQGLALALRMLADSGLRRVAFEDPGYSETGNQWPTGVVLAPQRRTALAAWAAERDAIIIEDDYDAEFRYDREPVGALQGIAANRVIGIGTVSKSLAPGVRLGWMLCPPRLVGPIAEQKRHSDRGSPVLDQLALATMIQSGQYDRHLRQMRALYGRRRDALADALARHAPAVRLSGLAAGFHAVAHLPGRASEHAVVAAARERSVGVYGMSTFRSTGAQRPAQLVIGFGNIGERSIAAGIAAVGDLLERPPES